MEDLYFCNLRFECSIFCGSLFPFLGGAMHWLTPLPAIYAAAAAIPLLVVLYFLKLKRRELSVSSTLLWKRAVQDLQVNAPIQRMRMNLLFLLQLLALAAILWRLGQPVLSLDTSAPKRYVILIDRSASMGTIEGKQTRLEIAKEKAKAFVQSLRGRTISLQDTGDQAMVVAFDKSAKVMCKFTTDKRQLAIAINSVTQSDSTSSLAQAAVVAQASSQSPGAEANNRSSVAPAVLELFSDGQVQDAAAVSIGASPLHFHQIGQASDNVAVTAMQVRRSYEKPEEVTVFAALSNYNAVPVDTRVELSINGEIRNVRPVQVPAPRPAAGTKAAMPGAVSVTFNLTCNAAGIVQVRQLRPDALPADDTAWAVLAAPGGCRCCWSPTATSPWRCGAGVLPAGQAGHQIPRGIRPPRGGGRAALQRGGPRPLRRPSCPAGDTSSSAARRHAPAHPGAGACPIPTLARLSTGAAATACFSSSTWPTSWPPSRKSSCCRATRRCWRTSPIRPPSRWCGMTTASTCWWAST